MTTQIGILSAAHLHAEAYAPILADMDGVELVGVAESDFDRGEAIARSTGVPLLEPGELLKQADGVVVCSTNADRSEWIQPAADAGVDILSEKPLATTADEAQTLAKYCARSGVAVDVAMPLRHSVPAQQAKDALIGGHIGELRAITGTNRGQLPSGWFTDPVAAGGGAVMDHTVHIVDLAHWLTGERVCEVYAETATQLHDITVEDINLLSMELTDGTQFSLDGSWSKPEEWEFWGDATAELIGTTGTISIDCFDETCQQTTSDGIEAVFYGTDPNQRMLAQFAETVENASPPAVSPDEAIAAVEVVEAAYESAECGEPVVVE